MQSRRHGALAFPIWAPQNASHRGDEQVVQHAVIGAAHVAAGAVAGVLASRVAKRPAYAITVALTVAIVAHFLMDAIPHSDYRALSREIRPLVAIIEVVLMSAAIAWILRGRLRPGQVQPLVAGVFGGVLPDLKFGAVVLPEAMEKAVVRFGERIHAFHAAPPESALAALLGEIAITVALFLWLIALASRRRVDLLRDARTTTT
jgi:hypothetical protein